VSVKGTPLIGHAAARGVACENVGRSEVCSGGWLHRDPGSVPPLWEVVIVPTGHRGRQKSTRR